jgi:transposase InsO family protein
VKAGVLERRSSLTVRTAPRGVLVRGDQVRWRGGRYTVTGLDGVVVYLAEDADAEEASWTLLLSALAGAADFALLDRAGLPVAQEDLPNFALLEGIPQAAAERALTWERAVVEVDTGLPPGAPQGARPRPAYDPASTTLIERYQAKAAELNSVLEWSVSWQTVQAKRLKYRRQRTVLALVDKRSSKAVRLCGDTDPLVVAALLVLVERQQQRLDAPCDARKLFKDTRRLVRAKHGALVPFPAESTMYRLLQRLGLKARDLGRIPTGSAVRGGPPLAVTRATAPGELVQIDSTDLDVWVMGDDGRPARVELTAVIDVATRSIIAAVLRPKQPAKRGKKRKGTGWEEELPRPKGRATKAVDVSILLAQCLVPVPMRPGYDPAVLASASELPYEELVALDPRFAYAAARPVIIPDMIVIDHGTVFAGRTFFDTCAYLGISVQPARKRTGRDKAIVERTFGSIKSGFSQYVNSYTGKDPVRARRSVDGIELWTVPELDDRFQQWVALHWQNEPHPELFDPRDTYLPDHSPNQMYRALVEIDGYLPIPMGEKDYVPLLPTAWVGVGPQGIRFRNRTYDNPERDPSKGLNPFRGVRSPRRRHGKGGWEMRHNPNDPSRVWLRDPSGENRWVEAVWVHQERVGAPWTEYLWDIATALFLERGGSLKEEEAERAISDALVNLLEELGRGPVRAGAQPRVPDGYVALPPPGPPTTSGPSTDGDPAQWAGADPLALEVAGLSPAAGSASLDWAMGPLAPDPVLGAFEGSWTAAPRHDTQRERREALQARFDRVAAALDSENEQDGAQPEGAGPTV